MPRLLKTEQSQHHLGFERYCALGEKRTYAQVASEMGVDPTTVKLWARSFNWQERVHARDLELARQIADKTLKTGLDDRARRRKLIDLALAKLFRAIAEDRVKYQISDLERIVRLVEEWDASGKWSGKPPRFDPHEIVEYLTSLCAADLIAAYRIMRAQLVEVYPDYPGYTERRLPAPAEAVRGESNCATLGVLDAAMATVALDRPEDA